MSVLSASQIMNDINSVKTSSCKSFDLVSNISIHDLKLQSQKKFANNGHHNDDGDFHVHKNGEVHKGDHHAHAIDTPALSRRHSIAHT